ncbi:phage capsid protein [Sphingomonas trueperi]|uniref:Uncharacterized protein n=1 Tax=Sphingomonas trueperi TaxID=53317 RepID=A0A7X6BF01_9SPHN|nr:phage capsid protein [Sphingomonas trueperi]NJB99870.1 hypothetical protein [Sphingomonas trueperi]
MPENWADTTRTAEYQANVEFQLNETPGRAQMFAGSKGSHSGASVEITDRFSDMEAHEIEGRNADTVNTDTSVERRWMHKPRRRAVIPLLDPDDAMSTSVDIKSPLVVGTARGIRRTQDDAFLEGYFGTAYTGEKGTIAVPFKSANVMASDYGTTGTQTGMTLNKLIDMQMMISESFADEEETPIIPVTPRQVADLLKIPEIRSKDFNPQDVMPLQSGKVATFLGFTFVPMRYGSAKAYPRGSALTLASASPNIRSVPVFVPSGIHRGSWLEFESHIDLRADKNHSTQIAGYTCVGFTRLNEDKCFVMQCKEG